MYESVQGNVLACADSVSEWSVDSMTVIVLQVFFF